MMKILILLMLVLLFVVSCGGGGEDNSCVNENEERIIPCSTDSDKEQKQICSQGKWIDEGFCYLCEENSKRTITCATDETRDQIQICYSDNWVDEGGCICTDDDKFCHEYDGFFWSDASSRNMKWDEAVTYCKNLGGRLPTISELRTIIQNCPATETGGECGVTDDCLFSDCWTDPCRGCGTYDKSGKYSVFGDTYWFWSSSEHPEYTDSAWQVNFGGGHVNYDRKGSRYSYVRCVK